MSDPSPRLMDGRFVAAWVAALAGLLASGIGGPGAVAGAAPGGEPDAAAPAPASAPAPAPRASRDQAMNDSVTEGAAALLHQLDRSPDRPARVLLRLKPGATALARVQQALALQQLSGETIAGRPMLVVELTPAQLRAVLASGEVQRVQLDGAAPSH